DADAELLDRVRHLAVRLEGGGQHEALVDVERIPFEDRPQLLHPRVVSAHLDPGRGHAVRLLLSQMIPPAEAPPQQIATAGIAGDDDSCGRAGRPAGPRKQRSPSPPWAS